MRHQSRDLVVLVARAPRAIQRWLTGSSLFTMRLSLTAEQRNSRSRAYARASCAVAKRRESPSHSPESSITTSIFQDMTPSLITCRADLSLPVRHGRYLGPRRIESLHLGERVPVSSGALFPNAGRSRAPPRAVAAHWNEVRDQIRIVDRASGFSSTSVSTSSVKTKSYFSPIGRIANACRCSPGDA